MTVGSLAQEITAAAIALKEGLPANANAQEPAAVPPPAPSGDLGAFAQVQPLAPTEVTIQARFGEDFSTQVLALLVRDVQFAREAVAFLKPSHFMNNIDHNIAFFVLDFVGKYNQLPEGKTIILIFNETKKIAPLKKQHIQRYLDLYKTKISNHQFVRDKLLDFARHQAMLRLAGQIPDMLARGDFGKIVDEVQKAAALGSASQAQFLDFFGRADERLNRRTQVAAGNVSTGVSTGIAEIDRRLYHKGFGRGELVVVMAPSKAGKTAFLSEMAVESVYKGHNWLIISLEVGQDVLEDRLDAKVSSTPLDDILRERAAVAARIKHLASQPGMGKIWVETRSSNSFSSKDLEILLDGYLAAGLKLDGVIVDYLGIMRLNPSDDRFVGMGNAAKELRRIAGKFNVAMLAGAQSNRSSVDKSVISMEFMGESFAVVQDCDLLLAIGMVKNAPRKRVINTAAVRNGANWVMQVEGDLSRMSVVGVIENIQDA